ncbi:MAG: OmpA family protein [Bacteroidales bacterium]|nr:OmpA family protein [Bacteroidales bacterium]
MKRYIIVIPIAILAVSLSYLPRISKIKSLGSTHTYSGYSYNSVNERECSFCHNDIINHKVLHAPATDDCETCHQSTGNKHPRVKEKGFILAEKMPDLCYMCHEQKNDKKNIHTPVEGGECVSCHSPHGAEYKYMLAESESSKLCLECHDIDLSENTNIHAPIELDGCLSCHDAHQSDNSFLLVEDKSKICATCHDNIEAEKQAEFLHAPFDDDCSNCHNPHSSKESFLLNSSTPELCFTCHDDISSQINESKNIHKVSGSKIECQKCHSPHSSSHNKILKEEQDVLCLNCHNKKIDTETKQIENIKEKLNNAKYKHAPIEDGCAVCHNPHASNNTALLNGAFPEGEYTKASVESFELCFNCHDTDLLEKEFSSTATNFRNGEQNLHFTHINGDKGRTCNICHDVHASKNKFLIKKRVNFGTWNMPMNFILKENGASCRTGCHTEKKYTRVKIPENDSINVTDSVTNHINNVADTINVVENIENSSVKNDTTVAVIIKDSVIVDNVEIKKDTVAISTIENITEIDSITTEKDTITHKSDNIVKNDTTITVTIKDSVIVDNVEIKKDTLTNDNITQIDSTTLNITKDSAEVSNTNNLEETIISEVEAFNRMLPLKVFFKFGKTEFEKNINNEIDKLTDFMNKYPAVTIQINGYTDSVGSTDYNIELSKKRATAVKKILTAKGILPKRIKIKAYGESNPVNTNETEDGRAENRRAEFELIRK